MANGSTKKLKVQLVNGTNGRDKHKDDDEVFKLVSNSSKSPKTTPRRRRHSSYVDPSDENQIRGNWSGKLDFILSCLSFAVGLGNVWRFPYQCYRNGGGAFVLPFMIMLVLAGVPLFFLETAFGQYASSGVVSIWKAAPIFQGLGGGMFMVSFFVSIYYNVIIAWTFFYLFSSFTTQLPWQTCDNPWNTPACRVNTYRESKSASQSCTQMGGVLYNSTCYTMNNTEAVEYDSILKVLGLNSSADGLVNSTVSVLAGNKTKSPSDEYFHNYVLNISDGFHDMGAPRWQLALCLLLAWTIICVCMIRGIKSSGRAVYFTATFPYLVLVILLIRGVTLPGSLNGILYYITPQWHMLLKARVWADAAVQIFFSLAPGWGPLISLSSYNRFKNNCLRDAYIVCIGDCVTSIFAGLVIFSIIGFMAYELDVAVDKVLDEGPGLAFIVYPEVVTRLPASPLWAVLFFLMLITLGIGTQFALLNTVHTTILDVFPHVFLRGWRPSFLLIGLCALQFLLGLSMCSRGGMYMLQIMDSYSASYAVLVIALTECIALAWIYGYERLQADIKLMLGRRIGVHWKILWKYISPITLVGILIFTLVEFERNRYGDYVFPVWSELLGWGIALSAVSCIPAVALYKICTQYTHLSIIERVKVLSRPTEDWGPGLFRAQTPREHKRSFGADFPLDDSLRPLKSTTLGQDTTVFGIEVKQNGRHNGYEEGIVETRVLPTQQQQCVVEKL